MKYRCFKKEGRLKKIIIETIYIQKMRIFLLYLIVIVATGLNNLLPLIFGKIIDYIVSDKLDYVLRNILIILFLEIIIHLLTFAEGYLGQFIMISSNYRIKNTIFNHILKMNCSDLDKYSTGELVNRIEKDCENVMDFYLNITIDILQTAISVIFPLVIIFRTSISLSVASLVIVPIIFIINKCFSKKVQKYVKMDRENSDIYLSFLNDIFSNIQNIKVFIMERKILQNHDAIYEQKIFLSRKQTFLNGQITLLKGAVENFISSMIMFYAAILIINKYLSLGQFVSFNQYISNLNINIKKITALHLQSKEVKVSFERLEQLMEKEEEEYKFSVNAISESNGIFMEGVFFSYNKSTPILKDINLCIDSAGLYSIVGKNGVGKSTLLKLIVQLYHPNSGVILIGKKNVDSVGCAYNRTMCTYVSKEKFLLKDTILNNITMDAKEMKMRDIIDVCNIIGLDQDIQKLPKGYDSIIGKDITALSSGQVQKLAIVRAVVRNTNIILLDESTSDMDGAAEKDIEELLLKLASAKIIIMVNHRERILKSSKKIFVLDKNSIIDSGTHTDLLKNCSIYQKLYNQ